MPQCRWGYNTTGTQTYIDAYNYVSLLYQEKHKLNNKRVS